MSGGDSHGPGNVGDGCKVASVRDEWDEWIGLHATRNEVAENYAVGLRAHGMEWAHWPDVNAAILRRWSPSGLIYIKEQAWKIAVRNLWI